MLSGRIPDGLPTHTAEFAGIFVVFTPACLADRGANNMLPRLGCVLFWGFTCVVEKRKINVVR